MSKPCNRARKVFGKCWAIPLRSRSVALVIQATGDFHDATVLRKFGDVPDDLSAL
jgi:hypothetical protein